MKRLSSAQRVDAIRRLNKLMGREPERMGRVIGMFGGALEVIRREEGRPPDAVELQRVKTEVDDA